jgi:hypothetical protein
MSRKIGNLFVGLLLSLPSACSINVGAPPRSVLRISNGKELTVVKRETLYFSDGPPALRLVYQTQIPISDEVKLKEEVYEIWRDFRNLVEDQHLTRAVISAVEPSSGALVEKIHGHHFRFEKTANGEWKEGD